jgi:hypothetical protein
MMLWIKTVMPGETMMMAERAVLSDVRMIAMACTLLDFAMETHDSIVENPTIIVPSVLILAFALGITEKLTVKTVEIITIKVFVALPVPILEVEAGDVKRASRCEKCHRLPLWPGMARYKGQRKPLIIRRC